MSRFFLVPFVFFGGERLPVKKTWGLENRQLTAYFPQGREGLRYPYVYVCVQALLLQAPDLLYLP